MSDVEIKAITDELAAKLTRKLKLDKLQNTVDREVRKYYDKGISDTEILFDMNFGRNTDNLNLLIDNTFANIRDLDTETRIKLRKELQQGMLNLETNAQIALRVKETMDTTVERAKLIARTETVRAYNMAALDSAKQSGLDVFKEWMATEDERTCPTCDHLHGQRVRLSDKFTGKDGEPLEQPPAHPRCRCALIFPQSDV